MESSGLKDQQIFEEMKEGVSRTGMPIFPALCVANIFLSQIEN